MSYEGYTQHVCPNGHYWEEDVYYYPDVNGVCPVCNKKSIWYNSVDITNGSFDEETGKRIDGYIKVKVIDEGYCPECGQQTVLIHEIPGGKKK